MNYSIPWFLGALQYHLWKKWRFVGFAYPPSTPLFSLPGVPLERIWRASAVDRSRIEHELISAMEHDEAIHDRRYLKQLGADGVECFVAERDGQLVHCCWVFLNAFGSAALKVPVMRRNVRVGDVYMGPVFTHPAARGTWVYPAVLHAVLQFVREIQPQARVLLVVAGDNGPGIVFFTRLGFVRLQQSSVCVE